MTELMYRCGSCGTIYKNTRPRSAAQVGGVVYDNGVSNCHCSAGHDAIREVTQKDLEKIARIGY